MKIYLVIAHHIDEDYTPDVIGAYVTLPEALAARNDYIMKNWLIDEDEDPEDIIHDLKQLKLDNNHEEVYVQETNINFN